MKKILPIAIIATSVLGLGSLTSCQDIEDENSQQIAYQRGYESSFVKTFGNVDPNQTWDFTSYARHQRVINQNLTRDMTEYESVADERGWYYVEDATEAWFHDYLTEGRDNSSQVNASVLRTEDKETIFEVVPLYQGQAGLSWKLGIRYVYEDGSTADVDLWSKGQNLQYSNRTSPSHTNDNHWTNVGTGNTINAAHIRSKPIKITVPAYTTMHFYLEITSLGGMGSQYGPVGLQHMSSSRPPQIGVVPCPLPTNIHSVNDGYSSYIIGCEDVDVLRQNAFTGAYISDKDYNDVVFLLTGYAPEVIYHDQPRTTYIRKRYMIEDLGDTYDYDFNDIVVDVTQTTTQIWVINTETQEAVPKPGTTPEISQEATVKYLSGTLPVQVKVGDTYFGQVSDPTNATDRAAQLERAWNVWGGPTCQPKTPVNSAPVNVTKTILNNTWNPDENNITAYVWKLEDASVAPSASATGIWTATFPGKGAIPYIIAVDQDVNPMPEREHIPDDWMVVVPETEGD